MTRILVTGAGGRSGAAVVRALGARGEHVIAVDRDPLGPRLGLHLAAERASICRADDPDRFVGELTALAHRFTADAIVSTVPDEMLALAGREDEVGIPMWLPARRSVASCVDRWRFWKIAQHKRIPAAPCALGAAGAGNLEYVVDTVAGPWIVKPRFAPRVRTAYRADTADELARACARIADPIVQTRLGGREFTVDLLADRDGRVAGAVPRWRLPGEHGISSMGRTFCDHRLGDLAERVVAIFGLRGAAHLHGFISDADEIALTTVEPRFSDGVALAHAAGSDLVGELVRGTLGQPVRRECLLYRPGVTLTAPDAQRFAA